MARVDSTVAQSGLGTSRSWCKQGLVSAVAVATDVGDGGTGGSGLRQQGLSEGWGGEEMK